MWYGIRVRLGVRVWGSDQRQNLASGSVLWFGVRVWLGVGLASYFGVGVWLGVKVWLGVVEV